MKDPLTLKSEAEVESYIYFDKHIRALPKTQSGHIDTLKPGFQNNDVDAFRHAYVSAVFTHEYGEKVASVLGWMREFINISFDTTKETNMDFWNNAVGRKLALKHKTKENLANAIKKALKDKELITYVDDDRIYEGPDLLKPDFEFSVIVLKENKKGVNEVFFDLNTSTIMSKHEFVAAIESGQYSGYTVRVRAGVKFPVSRRDGTNNLD